MKPLVAIHCLVYNHEPYLRECLDGFVMQKTNFPYVAIVHDDASADNSAAIIREYAEKYPEIIKPIYEVENHYSKRDGSHRRVMHTAIQQTGCIYMAMCEGDDYWVDENKLQKQVDFLETHPEYDLCCSASQVLIERTHTFEGVRGTALCENYETAIQGNNDILTGTILVRFAAWMQCYNEVNSKLPVELCFDTSCWYWFAYHSKVKYMPEPMAVYRELENSASHTTDYNVELKQQWRFIRLKLYFIANYPLRDNQQEVMSVLMQEMEHVLSLSRLCGERTVRQSKTYKVAKSIRNLFR